MVVLSKDFKDECLYCRHKFVAGVTPLRNHFVDWKDTSGRNVKICTGNMPQHVTSCAAAYVTSCAAARDFLLPNFYKNAVVSGEKFASN